MKYEKPFFQPYVKERSKYNPLRYLLGKLKVRWYEKGKYPNGFIDYFDYIQQNTYFDLNDILIVDDKGNINPFHNILIKAQLIKSRFNVDDWIKHADDWKDHK